MHLRRSSAALVALLLAATQIVPHTAFTQALPSGHTELAIMPLPMKTVSGEGEFLLDNSFDMIFVGHTEPRLERARQRFFDILKISTGLRRWPPQPGHQFRIETGAASAPFQQLGEDESYRLTVAPTQVSLIAPNPLGVLRGLQTFLQLVHSDKDGFAVTSVTIEDKPRFPWRGLMIDTARHFMPPSVIRQNLDAMESVKLNILHWHLSDDQGFRVESRIFPRLQGIGSDGQFYTQDEVRGIIDYARDRGIRVMPEFEMPSHASSLFIGYQELGDATGPYRLKRKLGEAWDRKRDPAEDSSMDPTRESTYIFLDRLLGEMSVLFPDAFLHVGGDAEDAIIEWATNPRMQKYMREHGYKDTAALQAYFTTRVQDLVRKHHKTMVGWDEILQPDTPKDVVIQSWKGLDSLAAAASTGHRGILSWGYYLDLNEPASRHYAVDPLQGAVAKLTPQQQASVIGGETAMWTEFVTPESINGRIWPSAAAVAERLWSPADTTGIDSMYARLAILSRYLAYRGLDSAATREIALQRMVGDADITPLRVLASVVEPPKGYPRGSTRKYIAYTPLNHLADVIPSESQQARDFRNLAHRIADGKAPLGDLQQARKWLTLWRENDAALQPLLPRSALTEELVPISRNLKEAAQIGLEVLDALEQRTHISEARQKEQLATLKSLNLSIAELTDEVIPAVETLVLAARP